MFTERLANFRDEVTEATGNLEREGSNELNITMFIVLA